MNNKQRAITGSLNMNIIGDSEQQSQELIEWILECLADLENEIKKTRHVLGEICKQEYDHAVMSNILHMQSSDITTQAAHVTTAMASVAWAMFTQPRRAQG